MLSRKRPTVLRRLCNLVNQPIQPTDWIALEHDQVDLFGERKCSMITQSAFYRQVMDSMEAMTDQVQALKALSGLLAGCKQHDVSLSELPYLLDLIIEKQEALVDGLMNTKNLVHFSPRPDKAAADNP
ncbi:MAG: hypothetical protein ACR65O_05500 [Methylomicrobium sp.]